MRAHVREALRDAGLAPSDLVPVRLTRYGAVLERVLETFTTFGVRGEDRLWLWEGLKGPQFSVSVEDGPGMLARLLPPHEVVWLLLEDWDGDKVRGNFWVFEGEVRAVVAVLNHLFFVEYYLVDRAFAWLLCENHHGVMTAVGEALPERLRAIVEPSAPASRGVEHGGLLYWSSLSDDLEGLDHLTDDRFLLIRTSEEKDALLDLLWRPVGRKLGLLFDAWEEECVEAKDLNVVLDFVRMLRRDPRAEKLHGWLDSAEAYLTRAFEAAEDVSVAL